MANQFLLQDDGALAELRDLTWAIHSGEIDSPGVARLEALVCSSLALRREYIQFARMLADTRLNVLGRNAETPHPADRAAHSTSSVLSFLSHTNTLLNRPVVWSILAVAVVFYGTFALFSWDLRPDEFPNGTTGKDVAVAMVKDATNASWSLDASPKSEKSTIRAGEPLKIDSGQVSLKLKRGAELIVEGPAEWSIEGENIATLYSGRLVARVSSQAVGFILNTPTSQIVDLGTEFGVEVDADGKTDVHVFEGLVEFAPQKSSAAAPPIRQQLLRAGEAARTDARSQTVVATEFVPDKFLRNTTRVANSARRRWIDLSHAATTQSSEFALAEYPSKLAIDGDPTTFSHPSVDDSKSWWQVDLGKERPIAIVVLQNEPSGRGWLRDITIRVFADDGTTVVANSRQLNPKNTFGGGELDFDHGPAQIVFDLVRGRREPVVGRFVRVEREACTVADDEMKTVDRRDIWLSGCKNTLVLGEVQVFELLVEKPVTTKTTER